MGFETLVLAREESFAIVTLNRPPANAISEPLIRELNDALNAVREDDSVRSVVITGAGDKIFCGGADLGSAFSGGDVEAFIRFGNSVMRKIERFGKPVIAAINGHAMGGGMEIAMACHFRLMKETARMGQTESNLGIIPGYGGTQRLPRLIGESRATEMILTGRTLDAQEAARIGLVNRLVDGDLVETGIAFAREMTGYSLPVLGLARDAIRRALDLPLPEGLKIEADLSTLAFQTKDSVEGMTAFIEKRKPVFKDG